MAPTSSDFAFAANLKNYNGTNVECVIADTPTWAGYLKLKNVRKNFLGEGVGLSITSHSCWCYGTETIDIESKLAQKPYGEFNATEDQGQFT